MSTVYRGFEQLKWDDCYFAINFTLNVKSVDILKKFSRVILSYHFQTFDLYNLLELFSDHPNQKFLFLLDQNVDIPEYKTLSDIFPNVTVLPWITWHSQLQTAIKWHGIADKSAPRSKKLSLLSGRKDIHKLIVTAFVLQKFHPEEYLCSFHNSITHDAYWEKDGFYVPENLKYLLDNMIKHDTKIILDPILDKKLRIPSITDWKYPAFTDCMVNLPLESQFNDVTQYQDHQLRIPGPMFTEKTWKPLLAGQSFLPIGQFHSCQSLQKFGLKFDIGLDLEFDNEIGEFSRLEKIIWILDSIKKMDHDELSHKSKINAEYNLETIKSGNFFKNCENHNQKILSSIRGWLEQ